MFHLTTIPPELIYELAIGLAPPLEIVAQHGYTQDDYDALMDMPSFVKAVADARREIHEEGFVRETMLQMMAQQLLARTFQDGISPTTPASLRLDITKNFANWAGLNRTATQGPSNTLMTVQINIPGVPQINVAPVAMEAIDGASTPIDVPNFSLDLALVGVPLPEGVE